MEWMKEIEAVIFDLDGTLYQDVSFHRRYIAYLLEGTEHEEQTDRFIEIADQILRNNHPVKIGCFYDFKLDCAWQGNRDEVTEVITWDGERLNPEKLNRGPWAENRVFPHDSFFYIGDAWSVVALLAKRFSLSYDKIKEAFTRLRESMLSEPYVIRRHQPLIDAIHSLTPLKRKILITNTFAASGRKFVQYLGLERCFDQIIYDGNKPQGMDFVVKALLQDGQYKPQQILSIGDNAWNDLHPVHRAGGRTIWVSPFTSVDTEHWDAACTSLDELTELLLALQRESHLLTR